VGPDIFYHSHNGVPVGIASQDPLPNRIASRKEAIGEGSIDYRYPWGSRSIILGELPPLKDRNTQRSEEARTDRVVTGYAAGHGQKHRSPVAHSANGTHLFLGA
jgi:hypothetical protein